MYLNPEVQQWYDSLLLQVSKDKQPDVLLGKQDSLKKFLSPKRYFNYRLSRARKVVEGAFGQLKGKWRVLMRKNEYKEETLKMFHLHVLFSTTSVLICIIVERLWGNSPNHL